MDLLVTGAKGLLGSVVTTRCDERGWGVVATTHSTPPDSPSLSAKWRSMDLTDPDRVEKVVSDANPDWVINCAGMTGVDECERNPRRAHETNALGASRLAEAAAGIDANICQLSTDYVFGDPTRSPHRSNEPPSPVQVYGCTKAAGEALVREQATSALIARVSFLYGVNQVTERMAGIVPWILEESRKRSVPLFGDQYVTPTNAEHAAEAILSLIDTEQTGTYHCSNRGCVTPYKLGRYALQSCEASDTHSPKKTTLGEADLLARRPAHSCLNTKRLELVLGRPQPDWRVGVDRLIRRDHS